MRLIIAGSRWFGPQHEDDEPTTEHQRVMLGAWNQFCSEHPMFELTEEVCGMARGVDLLGRHWAKHQSKPIPVKEMPADWTNFRKRAGHVRNEQMAMYAAQNHGALLAIWDGRSTGTRNMIHATLALSLPVTIYRLEDK